jgi:acyl-CoA synthetase (AMP-forming)/AMP-acid ligase II
MGSPWPSQAPYEQHHFSDLLKHTAERLPDKTAFISGDESKYTFSQIWDATQRTARMLQDEVNLKKGETTAILAPNCPEYAVALHGSLLTGAKVTTLNPLYKEREVQHQLDDADAVVVFVSKLFAPIMEAIKDDLPNVRKVYEIEDLWELASAHEPTPDPVEVDPMNDVAVLPYSSGTTGLPKGVMLTHHNLTSNLKQMMATGLTNEDSVLLAFLPFFHIYGLTVLLNATLVTGSTCLVMPRFDPEQTLAFIEKYKVTDFFVVPPALLALAHHPKLGETDLSSLRFILSGAAPLPPEVAAMAAERFGCPMIQGYGMTETSPLTNTVPIDAPKDGSVGPAVPDTEEKVVDMSTGDEMATGEVGELLIRGPQVMQGYWKNPESTAETLIGDGWLRSGDLGYMDEDGYVFIVDRIKEMIKYKGYQVAPAELEGVVMEHPAVRDAAVIPKRDFEAGEVPKAFVVLQEGQEATAADIMAFVADRVAPYKKLRDLEFVEAVPKSASGKILRRELIEQERAKDA